MQCPRCQQDNPSHAVFCLKCGTPLQRPDGKAQPAPSYADLQRSLNEALEQQAATTEIWRVIAGFPTDLRLMMNVVAENAARVCGAADAVVFKLEGDELLSVASYGDLPAIRSARADRSPTDVQPVFDAIAKSVMRLCAGDFSDVVRYEDDLLHLVACAHVASEGAETMKRLFPIRPSRELVKGRAVLDGVVVHIPDVMADSEYNHSFGEALRVRSIVGVPMLREGRAIGAISVWRAECRPFSDQHIALLKTFADQAVSFGRIR